nr:hypothetical protein [Mariniblastus sp.]
MKWPVTNANHKNVGKAAGIHAILLTNQPQFRIIVGAWQYSEVRWVD